MLGLLMEWPGNVFFHGNPAWREPPLAFSRGNWGGEGVVVCETPGMAPASPNPSPPWISWKSRAVPGVPRESQPGIREPQDPQSCPGVSRPPPGNRPGTPLGTREALEA